LWISTKFIARTLKRHLKSGSPYSLKANCQITDPVLKSNLHFHDVVLTDLCLDPTNPIPEGHRNSTLSAQPQELSNSHLSLERTQAATSPSQCLQEEE
jgi:hypothetical protein